MDRMWDCDDCEKERLQEARFCHHDAPFPIFEIDDRKFFRCPVKELDDETFESINVYNYFLQGHLPESGGMLDQDFYWVQVFGIVDNIQKQIQENKERRKRWLTQNLK
uniref:Uncharacterized protein n=1 Tax=viral metagenome TaxID=1070528 RepID=A0A6M3KZB4_9ZZZZ